MLLDNINNNTLISHLSLPGVYQDWPQKQDLYQEINIIFGLEPKQTKWINCGEYYSCRNKHIKITHDIFKRVMGAVGSFFKIPKIDR